jgi:hypothetical protein
MIGGMVTIQTRLFRIALYIGAKLYYGNAVFSQNFQKTIAP